MGSMICRLNRQMLLLFIDVAGVENGARPVHALRWGSLGSLVWRFGADRHRRPVAAGTPDDSSSEGWSCRSAQPPADHSIGPFQKPDDLLTSPGCGEQDRSVGV